MRETPTERLDRHLRGYLPNGHRRDTTDPGEQPYSVPDSTWRDGELLRQAELLQPGFCASYDKLHDAYVGARALRSGLAPPPRVQPEPPPIEPMVEDVEMPSAEDIYQPGPGELPPSQALVVANLVCKEENVLPSIADATPVPGSGRARVTCAKVFVTKHDPAFDGSLTGGTVAYGRLSFELPSRPVWLGE